MIGLVFLLAAVGTVTPSLESLNAVDLAAEVRPGGVNGSPFWNAFAWQFIYAPTFDFKPVDGAANYRFRLTDAQGREHVFCADSPQASLAPVWKDVAPGAARLEVTALDAGGKALGLVATNGFHRSAPFRPGAYPPAVCGYGACAERALDWMFRSPWVNGWASGEVDKTYQLNCYPSKMVPATMLAMVEYAKRHPEDRQKAMRIAENAADWMMANSVKEPESMRGLPITYLDYYEETKHLGDVWNSKKIAHEKRDQVMMIYPASVGKAYLGLFKATGKRKYFEYARTIADRYLALQRADGSWALVLEFPSGREVSSNAAGETGICEFLDEMGAETGDVRYRQASNRAIPAMVRRIREFDWEGQFEDTAVQRVRYANLTKHIAADTMLYLLDRFPDGRYAKDAREALRFAEDQFVAWSHPWGRRWYTPGVIEQYNCRVTIDASYAKMIRFYLKMYEIERNPLDLAKARALGDAITRNQQPDGLIPTVFPNDPGRAGRHWLNCMMATIHALLELEVMETEKVVATCQTPVSVTKSERGRVFVDFGKDAFGWLEISAPTGGAFTVWMGEKSRDGGVDRNPGGTIRATSAKDFVPTGDWRRVPLVADKRNTCGRSGEVPAPIPPRFGVVLPFRYAEIEGAPSDADWSVANFRRYALHVPMDLNASSFVSSDTTLNDVYALCKYSIWATSFAGLYVDGDRERIPYEADAYVNQIGHYAVDSSLGMGRDTIRWLARHPTWPTEWAQYLIMMVWADWMQSGRTDLAAETYDLLKTRKLYPRERDAEGLIVGNECDIVDWPVCERDGFEERPCDSKDPNGVVNAFHYRNLLEMRDLAEALERTQDAVRFADEAKAFLPVFNRRFLSAETGLYTDRIGGRHSSLHVNAAAVTCGLCPPERLTGVADFLEKKGMACSVFFAQHYLEALFKAGRAKTAIRLMADKGDRSWYGMIRDGSTITTEAWSLKVKPNQDWNHAWATAPLNLITRYVLGVRPTKPGFAEVEIAPQVGDLQEVEGQVPTPHGSVRVKVSCGKVTYEVPPQIDVRNSAVSVVDFGARTEADATANRAAIQRAIDAAAERGGRVTVPPGRWWTGSLQLKSGVELHLEKGAVLLGSTNRVDYNENTVFPENAFSVAEEWSGGHLVWAYRAHDIAITGEGVIDGNGPAFFGDCDEDSRFPYYKYGLKLHPLDTEWYRPGQMLAFYQVKNLRLEDVTLANTTAWTCYVRCSDGFVARRVKILADRTIANSDGFSIDCTRNVLVEKCTVRSGDDGFAIRASCGHHAATNACEDIVIRDCDVWSCCYGVRFGIGSGDLRRVLVENSRVHESANGFGFMPSWVKGERGVHIRDITVRNCSSCESERPVCIGPGSSRGCVRDIRFENCRFEALAPSRIVGNDVCDVDGFVFTNCTYRRIGKVKVRQSGMGADSLERARIFAETNAWVKNVRFENCVPGPVRPGVLVLAFDDRRFADWEKAMPLFAKYDAHATFFISGEIGADVIGSVKRLVRAGHSVGLHGQHHLDAPEAIREKGYAWYRSSEINHPRRQLQVSLLRTFAFAYPNNARTDETDKALLQDFRRLRAGVPGAAPYDPEGKKQSGRIPLHENDALFFPVDELRNRRVISGAIIGEAYHTKIDEVLKCLERAAKNREVVEFTSHGISPDAKRINMKTEWLEAILAKAQELGLEVLSFDELDRPNGGQ